MAATPNGTIIADTNGAIKFTGLKMAAAYTMYATQVSDALQTLVKTTGVKVNPAVDFVSCGSGLHEHFVPKTSLEKHLVRSVPGLDWDVKALGFELTLACCCIDVVIEQ